MLKEARRLYDLGFAIHWLRPKTKMPCEKGWTTGPRQSWEELDKKYQAGMNLGVRLGTPSTLGTEPDASFLSVIDCDVKSSDPKHLGEMLEKLQALVKEDVTSTPFVETGRGNGSMHIYVRTREAAHGHNLARSTERVRVLLKVRGRPTDIEKAELTQSEIDIGWRFRPAWEISLMGTGQQVVLPPSIHPDTGTEYKWGRTCTEISGITLIESILQLKRERLQETHLPPFTRVDVDLVGSSLSDHIVDLILTGKGSKDSNRSNDMLLVAIAMLQAGMTDDEILSVLSEPGTYFGEAVSERNGVQWVQKYTLPEAKRRALASHIFAGEIKVEEPLSKEAEVLQTEQVLGDPADWRELLDRNDKKGLKANLHNVLSVLTNDVSPKIFTRNIFSMREAYGALTPWGGQPGKLLTDLEAILIKRWFTDVWHIEPNVNLISEAMSAIATKNEFHPVREYLSSLQWDMVPRLDSALRHYFNAEGDKEYLSQVFRKFMVAAVTRIYRPGFKFDWMLILEGKQNIGKSSFPRILAGDEWFVDWLPNFADKDAALGLQGIWFYEMGELSNLRKTELEIIKGFVTRQIDKVRPPYGRRVVEIPRQCVFMGTTNQDEYLKDETGNRRFKPVVVHQLDFKTLKRDRDQLFAEAMFIYENELEGILELTGSAKESEKIIHSEKTVTDISEAMTEALAEGIGPDHEPLPDIKLSLIKLFKDSQPLGKWKLDAQNIRFGARALKNAGYERYHSEGKFWRKIQK